MSFTAEVNRRPEEVLELLGLSSEPGDSWGKTYALTSPTSRVYIRVTGNEFQASRHAGMSMFGVIASGAVKGTSHGTLVEVQLRFGIAPYGFPQALLVASLVVAIVGMLRSLGFTSELFAWAGLPAAVSLFWWHARWDVRVMLEDLGAALGGVSWRET